ERPGASVKVDLAPSSVSEPAQKPVVPAGQLTFTFSAPFFVARTFAFAMPTPANGGNTTRTAAVALAKRPVESLTVTVPKWSPGDENVRCTEAPGAPPPSSNVHEKERASPAASHEPAESKFTS